MTSASAEWVDISVPLKHGMVHWPGDPEVRIERFLDMARGDPCTVTALSMSAHTGTHIDAPSHFIAGGACIDELPPDACVGPARVVEIRDHVAIRPEELESHSIAPGERILFRTRNSERCWRLSSFVEHFVYISKEAAVYLSERRVRTVGIDYLSVGGYTTDLAESHVALLSAGVWVIEGLDLSRVTAGEYELVCLPLRIEGADGAPARALLRRIQHAS